MPSVNSPNQGEAPRQNGDAHQDQDPQDNEQTESECSGDEENEDDDSVVSLSELPVNQRSYQSLLSKCKRLEKTILVLKKKIESQKMIFTKDKRILRSEIATERSLQKILERKLRSEASVTVSQWKNSVTELNSELRKARSMFTQETSLRQREAVRHSSTESYLKITRKENEELKKKLRISQKEVEKLTKLNENLQKEDKKHEVEMTLMVNEIFS